MHKALRRAHEYGFECLAVFVRNQVQWRIPPLRDEDVGKFRSVRSELGLGPVVAHASYLVNLAGRGEIRRKSLRAMVADLKRCDRLGIEYLVLHPGSRGDATTGIALISRALNRIVAALPSGQTKILLETTAGQGNAIGHTFGQLAEILSMLDQPGCFGVCLDTCHIFAAGYDIRTPDGYRQTMRAFVKTIGLDKLLAIHLNDSKRPLGSRIDRHAHIGRGKIGRKGLASFVNDGRLQKVPMILETPKGADEKGRDWDLLNARTLRRLSKSGRRV